jgi:hypothetical protein
MYIRAMQKKGRYKSFEAAGLGCDF